MFGMLSVLAELQRAPPAALIGDLQRRQQQDLDDLPGRTVRAMAGRLGMTWPEWLETSSVPWSKRNADQSPPELDTTVDATVHVARRGGRPSPGRGGESQGPRRARRRAGRTDRT
jgi:hypothetical protein